MSIINKMLNDLEERGVLAGQPLTEPHATLQNTRERAPLSSTSSARRRIFYITLGIIITGLIGLLVEQGVSNKLPESFATLFNNTNKTAPPTSTIPLASPETNTLASATDKPTKVANATRLAKEQQEAEAIRVAREQQATENARLAEEKKAAETALLAKRQQEAAAEKLAQEQQALKAAQLAEEKQATEAALLVKKQQAAEAAKLAKEQKRAEAARLAKEKQEAETVRLARKKQDAEVVQLAKRQKEAKAAKLAQTKQEADNKLTLAEQTIIKKTDQAPPASSQTADPVAQSLDGVLNQDATKPQTQAYVLLPSAKEVGGTSAASTNPLPPIASMPIANRATVTTQVSSKNSPVIAQAEQVKPPITTAPPSTTSLAEATVKPVERSSVSNQLGALVASGDKAGAIKLLGALQSQDPANATWAVEKSRLELQLGQATTALVSLQKTLPKIRPTANYYALLGGTAYTAKAYTQANDYYLNAIRLEPREGRWYFGLGRALQAQGKTETAVNAYTQALASGSLSPELADFAHLQISQMSK